MSYLDGSSLRRRTFDRLKKSLAGQNTDRHAAFNYYTFPFFQNATNVSLQEYFNIPKVMFEVQLEVFEQLEGCGNFSPDLGPTVESNAIGAEVQFNEKGFPSVKPMELKDLADVLKLKPVNPYGNNSMRKALECLEYMTEHAPEGYKVNPPMVMAPFTVAAQVFGISDFLMSTILKPDIVTAMLDIAIESTVVYMKETEKILGAPLHHVLLCDDLSAMLSLEDYETWVVPTYKRFFREFPNTRMWLHNDATTNHIAAAIADIGFEAWQYAPSLTPEYVREKTRGKISLIGGLDPLKLQNMACGEAYNYCIKVLETFRGDNRFILAAGGAINQISVENTLAILQAADDYQI